MVCWHLLACGVRYKERALCGLAAFCARTLHGGNGGGVWWRWDSCSEGLWRARRGLTALFSRVRLSPCCALQGRLLARLSQLSERGWTQDKQITQNTASHRSLQDTRSAWYLELFAEPHLLLEGLG